MQKTLDQKIANLLADPGCGDFILADAKDADMAFGLAAPGRSPEHHSGEARFRTLDDYRELVRDVVRQGLVDIALMSASTAEWLVMKERLFDDSAVTPAIRANDTTDIWLAAGSGDYTAQPSRPFRTATIDHVMCGQAECGSDQPTTGVDLGLYSVTLNNDTQLDRETLEAYKAFRLEAEPKGFRHFLEVFPPNACGDRCPEDVARFVNDSIVRLLAGVTSRGRPLFLKIPYFGPAAMQQLTRFDRSLVVGILGGSAGTTYDAFHMLWEAKKNGARAALFGRKINNAEHQLTFIQYLRAIADDQIEPQEAVRAYHGDLNRLNIAPHRTLEADLQQTATAASYGSAGSQGPARRPQATPSDPSATTPDFSRMTPAEKVQWNLDKWRRILG